MPAERILLKDGVYLNIIECDKFKTNFVSVDFLSELSPDTAAEYALLPFVLSRGTKSCPDMASMTKKLDMLYGSRIVPTLSKTGDVQCFGFASYPLRSEYTDGADITLEMLGIIGEMLNSPYTENGLLSSAYVESEKAIMTDRINAKINDKGHYSLLRCREEMTEGEAYALPETGTAEQVAKITAESLTKTLSVVMSSLRAEIYCIGSFDKDKLKNKAAEIFSSTERMPARPLSCERTSPRKEIKRVTEAQPVNQGKLCIGFKTGCYPEDEMLPAYTMFTEVLSGSPTAKLFTNVREKLSLCYYCYAISDINKGIMIVSSGIDMKDKEAAEKAIFKEIDDCKNGNIADTELQAARKAITNAIKSMYDDAGAIKSWYSRRGIFTSAPEPFDYLEKVLAVTKEDIVAAANRLVPDTVYFLKGDGSVSMNDVEEN